MLANALTLTSPIATGARARGGPDGLPVDGGVVWADSERFAVRADDALYTFHHGSGLALMFHHLFAPTAPTTSTTPTAPTTPDAAEQTWQQWLTNTIQGD